MEPDLDIPCDEMTHRISFRTELESTSVRRSMSKTNLISPIHSTSHSTFNTARRDNVTGIITIPASSLSMANINMSSENLISGYLSGTSSAAISPKNSFVVNSENRDSYKRPTSLPAHLFPINDNSDHDVDGVLKTLDEEGESDYFVGVHQ